MAEITLHCTQEELSMLLDALNHSCIALGKVYAAARFGCELPAEFYNKFQSMSYEEIEKYTIQRFSCLRKLYDYLLTFEE